jgi:hypothetical protein
MTRSKILQILLSMVLCFAVSSPAWSQQVVQSIGWQEVAAANRLATGTVVARPEGVDGPSLRVVHRGPEPVTLRLLTIERPPISTARFALRGRVKYDDVAAGSYLEMWTTLAEGAFFSRTLEQQGPMGRLDGTSGWRAFLLPFANREGGSPPVTLVFNVVMAGAGTVEIGPLELVQFQSGQAFLSDSVAWWTARQTGVVGGIVGSVLGVLGAIFGWLGSTGRAKGLVLGTLRTIAWLGVGSLALGGWAVAAGQPYDVVYPLLLIGTLTAALGFGLPRTLSKRYEELELRRIRALDA